MCKPPDLLIQSSGNEDLFAHQHHVDSNSISQPINEFDLVLGTREVNPRLPLQHSLPDIRECSSNMYLFCCQYVCMTKRTTIEIDEGLLARAKKALGARTTRATVEESLRLAAQTAEDARSARATGQQDYLERLTKRVDLKVLSSEEMWR